MGETNEYLTFATRAEWRAWLEEHHAKETQVWLAHYKKGTKPGALTYEEAVEEALCFGWIDGLLRRLDAERFALRYSPRRRNSVWAESNKQRVEKLIRQGRMTPADLERALRRHQGALAAFRNLPASRKKQYFYWIASAKRVEARQERIRAIADALAKES